MPLPAAIRCSGSDRENAGMRPNPRAFQYASSAIGGARPAAKKIAARQRYARNSAAGAIRNAVFDGLIASA